MKILDTNIIIYASRPEHAALRNLFAEADVFVSDICRVETLGYHLITESEREYFEDVFNVLPSISITEKIIRLAIVLRQSKKYSLGDALIAATAVANNLTLITANTKDFKDVPNLKVKNPLDQTS